MAEQLTLYIAGTSDTLIVPAIPTPLTEASIISIGPAEDAPALAIKVRCGHFVTADNTEITVDSSIFTADNSTGRPRIGKKCIFRNVSYRIISATEDSTRAYLRIVLGSGK